MARRLAAILAADVVGYSRLMGKDEKGTLERLKALRRDLVQSKISEHGGRIVKLMGDGLLAEFPSVVEAVHCAAGIQEGMAGREPDLAEDERIRLRIGVNLGDIIVEGSDIYGDGVNVAARLEALAEPGGICISRPVHTQIKGKVEVEFEDLGEQNLKNVSEPVRVYRIIQNHSGSGSASEARAALSLPAKPSIAVLPFDNMSGDPDQEYFADGMVEEIITALSHMRWLFVIARNSSFTYKGRAVNVKQVGQELGVRYVLEGSVRKAGNRVRITGQLVDAATGAHLWAGRFDGTLEDVFDLQDQVTSSVVGAIAPKLEQAEIERAKHKPTESLDAYDYYLRGMAAVHLWTREKNDEALSMLYRAIELDPDFALAYGLASRCFSMRRASGWMVDSEAETAEAIRLARRAAELGKDDALALSTAGIGLGYGACELEEGGALLDHALSLNPNLAWGWLFSGWVKVWLGQPEEAIERAERAMRLSPHDPHLFGMQAAIAAAHFSAGRYKEALASAKTALRAHAHIPLAACAAASAAMLGDVAESEKAMTVLRQLDPDLRISNLSNLFPARRKEDLDTWADGLRRAGLPE
jgi:TolB-like protein/class 3 adenylate cyclase/tetratricopeptide (TPR) repeat protein